MKKNYTVYVHISPNNKYYVGITVRKTKERWNNGNGYKTQLYFHRAIEKYGWDSFQHEIIASGITEDEAKNFEKILIKELKSNNRRCGYNLTNGGEGTPGYKCSKKTKIKISKANLGKRHSEETKAKISKARLGKKMSNETKKKISKANVGKIVSDKTRQKLSKANIGNAGFKGYKHSNETKIRMREAKIGGKLSDGHKAKISKAMCGIGNKPIYQIDQKTNKIIREWESISKATKQTGICKQNISAVCRNKLKSAGGYKWRFIELNDK